MSNARSSERLAPFAPVVLRVGLAAVYLYFGISQLLSPVDWTGWLPAWSSVIPLAPTTLILCNGVFEVVFALALLAGFWTRFVAVVLTLHMLVITLDIGFTEIGARDFGLTIATAALAMLGAGPWSIDAWRART